MKNKMKIVWIGVLCLGIGWWLGSSEHVEVDEGARGVDEPSAAEVWTCAMHPQIRQPSAGLCPICAMELIVVARSASAEVGARELVLSPGAERLAEVQTAVVERRFAEVETRMVGKIALDETRLRDVTARVPGRIDRLYVDYTGVQINEGDHMVYLYSPELLTAQQELVQALRAQEQLDEQSMAALRQTAASTIESARQKLRLWGLTAEQVAQVERARTPADHLTIYAPESGVVVERHVGQGAYVQTGQRIYTIVDLSHVWLKLEAYESDLLWIRYGQQVVFSTESFPGERFFGTVSFIDPLVDEQTRTVGVRVNVDNTDGRLKPGMLARATVRARADASGKAVDAALAGKWISPMHPEIVKDQPGLCDVCGMALVRADSLGYVDVSSDSTVAPLLLPISAPLVTGKRAVVYVAVPGRPGHYEGREIELGPRAGDYYIVRSGLRVGEQVVVNGAFKIDSALQIQAKPSMMSTDHLSAHAAHGVLGAKTADADALVGAVFSSYLSVQQGLSADSMSEAMLGAKRLQAALDAGATGTLPAPALWKRVNTALNALLIAPDIEAARTAFSPLSVALIELADQVGTGTASELGLYQCPMAFDSGGAVWIQRIGPIENPYFGASMLRCGRQQRSVATTGQ